MQSEMNSYPLNSISLDFFIPLLPLPQPPPNNSVVCSVHFTSALQNLTFSASLWYAKDFVNLEIYLSNIVRSS